MSSAHAVLPIADLRRELRERIEESLAHYGECVFTAREWEKSERPDMEAVMNASSYVRVQGDSILTLLAVQAVED